jgi:hypothetical protein
MTLKIKHSTGSIKNIHFLRIPTGEDLVSSIFALCEHAKINTAVLVSCVGSLKKATFQWSKYSPETLRKSVRTDPFILDGPIELLSAQGLVGIDTETQEPINHFHVTLCDQEGKTYGGHITMGGNIVHSTMDVVLLEIDKINLRTTYDPSVELKLIEGFND